MWDLETCFPFLKVYSSFCFPKSPIFEKYIFQVSVSGVPSTKYSIESFLMKKVRVVNFGSFMYFPSLRLQEIDVNQKSANMEC